ncbi:hypothetical protein OM076_10725 [Solirubrobacter ginsenosidimutans]|uniref:Uncharacterized protein n=1 Tax=Solirubrobacter ginsenosidimutans TaxID=490573 RepID=A0A9X3RZY4_9ACTN|nr:hypothetical protein [Solirubrobacter ginsenosidimutans]MDA0160739.1 hypothetical protein [Solirubrobacter ginsenosidimutans]
MTAPYTNLSANDGVASRRRPLRAAAAAIGATVVIAIGAYATKQYSSGSPPVSRSAPTTREHVSSEHAMREMRMTIRALYGPQPRLQRSRRHGV